MSRPAEPILELVLNDGLQSQGYSLRTKAIIATVATVTICTVLSGYLTSHMATEAMSQSLINETRTLAQTTSDMVEGYINSGRQDGLGDALKRMMQDKRIAFLVVSDPNGRTIDHQYNEPLAWHEYQRHFTPQQRLTPLTLNRPLTLTRPDKSLLVVRRQQLRSKTNDDKIATYLATSKSSQTLGYLEIGLNDPEQSQIIGDLQDATIIVVVVICLLGLPIVVWWAHHWTQPLRRMLNASRRLSLGENFQPIPDHGNDEIGQLARSFNAMAQHLSETHQALIQSNTKLEHRVVERTAELERAKLNLEREINEKNDFIRAVSHDLGAPLRNITGLTQMLILKHSEHIADEAMTKLQRIAANAKAETELLGDLLELSRIRTHQGKRQKIDLNELINEISETLAYDLENKGITMIIDSPLPMIMAERNRMRQVFQNLIDNAIKYMPNDSTVREIHVGYHRTTRGRTFYVRDTGWGISEKDQQAVFQVFRRARYSRKTDAPGKGVGLATTKTIIECYDGMIWIESDSPNGATFNFTIGEKYFIGPTNTTTAKPSQTCAAAH